MLTRMDASKQTHEQRLAYGIEEAARAIGVSRGHLYELIARGEVRSVKLGDRRLIPTDELRRVLSTSTTESAP